tara:strand:+ start:816 stop:1310 length:495 start_codon:yes stop_codon:yes gene_type:complete
MFNKKKHNTDFYIKLLNLSRNLFFYKKIGLKDSFETRVFLMFFHFSIIMIIFKKKGKKFDQNTYDNLFYNIENNLREIGLGDVSVNKKMKDLNKLLYDILLKLQIEDDNKFKINEKIVLKYFPELSEQKNHKIIEFIKYFEHFFDFCFDLSLHNVLNNIEDYKF